MQSAWLSALSFLVVSTLVGVGMLAVARVLRVKARAEGSALKTRTYECGEEPTGMAWMQFHARYYVVALFFVVFDVEAVFLFPWAVVLRELGMPGLVAAIVFVLVLMLGWLYAIKKEALRWQ
ncbi:MAG: NADH-quinone oxidoreductase subunit A [Deltaproteobacteria bacterium]|nr:NADH-quinone oxidoreductase subunit A [Deltaproteobacteria bacterium]